MNKYYHAVFKSGSPTTKNDEMSLMQHEEKSGKSTYNKGQGSKKKFSGNCLNCGKKGHRATKCWKDPKNASKRPAWYKTSGEINAAQTDGRKSEELQLANISWGCLLYTSPSPRDLSTSRMPSSA